MSRTKSVPSLRGVKACVFDAYGTLLDVAAAARRCERALGGKAAQLTEAWRIKQLQHTWLRSLMGEYVDFATVTSESLDYALAAVGIKDERGRLRSRLLDIYRVLDAYPDAKPTLRRLQSAGFKTAILSNGSPPMLRAAVESAGIDSLLDRVLSVHSLKIYKPDPRVYRLATRAFKLKPAEICFVSGNGWDAWAAGNFGMRVVWINRAGLPEETMPGRIAAQARALADVPRLLGVAGT
ncbi:MAG: haloacid dehalogenase type II [Alphaproteobacteria bacterium]|nr:haloacid dehalogenase type II [Alphaproteobacteria bacterium]